MVNEATKVKWENRIKILIIDYFQISMDAMMNVFGAQDDMIVVGRANRKKEAVDIIVASRPDIVVIGPSVGSFDPVAISTAIDSGILLEHELRTIIVSPTTADNKHLKSLTKEIDNVHKVVPYISLEDLLDTVRQVGIDLVEGRMLEALGNNPFAYEKKQIKGEIDKLSKRERETLYWLAQGFDNCLMAEAMFISEKTVRNRVSNLLQKLSVPHRSRLISLLWQTDFVSHYMFDEMGLL